MVAERLGCVPRIIILVTALAFGLGGMAGGAPLIDTKLLCRPPKFEGDIGNWKQWRFQVLAYFGALEPELCDDRLRRLDSGKASAEQGCLLCSVSAVA